MRFITILTLAAIAVGTAANASLPRFDDDKNGELSISEWLDAFGPEKGREQFYHIDRNNDLVIDKHEYQAETNDAGILANK